MLLPPALVYVLGGMGVAALAGVFVSDRQLTPRKWLTRTLIAVMAASAIITIVLLFASTKVVRVTGDDGLTVEHSLLLGSTAELPWASGTTIVINESNRDVRIESHLYTSDGGGGPNVTIAPGTQYVHWDPLHYVGPDDHPPSEISSKSSHEMKHWLTW